MSLLGKILAALNFFGAIGLVCMATMDYTTRQAWAYNQARLALVLTGLPLDEHEQAANGAPVAGLFGAESLTKIFQPVGGNPVVTQLQEVSRVKEELDAKVQAAAANKRAQTYLFARILLPLADDHVLREQLLACRAHLPTDATLAALKNRYATAFRSAVQPPPAGDEKPSTFEEAFRTAVRTEGGQPSQTFTTMLLKALPAEREQAKSVAIDAVFDATLEAQRKQLETTYNDLFTTAFMGPMPASVLARAKADKIIDADSDKGKPIETQKAFIARLLFGLCLFRAEDAVETNPAMRKDAALLQGLPRDGAKFGELLPNTDAYKNMVKRVQLVCGLRSSLDAVSDRTLVLRKLADYLVGTAAEERQLFVADQMALVEEIRERAALVVQELAHKAESERKLSVQEEQVKKRQRDVKDLQDEYVVLLGKTQDRVIELRDLSQKLLDDRVKARDLLRQTQESEKTIRDLEKKIRDLNGRK